MNRLFRLTNTFVLCCVSLFLFAVHTNVGQCGLKVEAVEVTTYWEPGSETWLKLPRYATSSGSGEPFALKPAHSSQLHPLTTFNAFLPPRTENVVGDVWAFDVRRMLPFLRQFHPGATVSLSGQQGAYACLRAVSPEYYEIVFQFHADFNLEMQEIEGIMVDGIKSVEKAIAELNQEQVEEAFAALTKSQDEASAGLQKAVDKQAARLQKEQAEPDPPDDLANLKKELAETVAALEKVTASLESSSEDLETRLNELKTTITALEELVSNLDARFDALEKALTAHFDTKLNELEKTLVKNLDARLDELEQELTAKFDAEFSALEKMLTAQEYTLTQRLEALLTAEVAKLKGTRAYNEGIYLKPKQFRGRLLIRKATGRFMRQIKAFTIECPAHDGNATLFVFGDTETVSMPRMELTSDNNIETKKIDITWTDTITAEQAEEILRSKFASRMSQTENPIETR